MDIQCTRVRMAICECICYSCLCIFECGKVFVCTIKCMCVFVRVFDCHMRVFVCGNLLMKPCFFFVIYLSM